MASNAVVNDRLDRLADYPFARLTTLLADLQPATNRPPVVMSIGEPQHTPPDLIRDAIAKSPPDAWGKYPPMAGTPEWRAAALGWLARRYPLGGRLVDPDKGILPLAGTREGLYLAAQLCVPSQKAGRQPAVLLPNPFYAVYDGAGRLAGAEPVYLPATRETGFLPDLDAIPEDTLARTALMFLTSPANPQGACADAAYLRKALALARTYGFTLAVDECYADIYDAAPPVGALDAAAGTGGGPAGGGDPLANLLVFHSLSKRSSAAGLRSGFVAGDARLIQAFARMRSYAHAGTPVAGFAAATALWADDAHAEENRRLYRQKIDAAEAALGGRFGCFYRPPGGFFLWLDVGDGEAACRRLWREGGLRVLPGAYVTRPDSQGVNHGSPYIRVALVHDAAIVAEACARMAEILDC
ncbi:MAG TPA: aminotransferase class I/II-fold pyridoxal phosphate-dependent enzyme [Azospirillaceae bacterium]|nr:aminotransferase class I/II-fold pyridoxal phosphate-dependent enzyme [Azospirillaceae bacterium]